jgi:hypothetical protein
MDDGEKSMENIAPIPKGISPFVRCAKFVSKILDISMDWE